MQNVWSLFGWIESKQPRAWQGMDYPSDLYCPLHTGYKVATLYYTAVKFVGVVSISKSVSQSVCQCVISANWIDLDWMFCSSFLPSLQLYKWFSDIFYQIMKLICEKRPAIQWLEIFYRNFTYYLDLFQRLMPIKC